MKLKHLSLSVMIMGTAFGLASTQAAASGYQFGSQSVSGQGTAHANGAEANDPSTIFTNPAGLSRLDGTQLVVGGTLVVPHSEYTDNGSTNILGKPTGGGNGGTFAPKAVAAPTFYLSHKVNDKITAGIGVFVPYGAKLLSICLTRSTTRSPPASAYSCRMARNWTTASTGLAVTP
ncbi:OmpP1/FadL family transporter [Chromobacterium amazonense]|uniref:OmpP1/FadL family transporter n=1 Tax=Chromobacterium amazonense TaxID=1382803 RepID=UPI0030B89B94